MLRTILSALTLLALILFACDTNEDMSGSPKIVFKSVSVKESTGGPAIDVTFSYTDDGDLGFKSPGLPRYQVYAYENGKVTSHFVPIIFHYKAPQPISSFFPRVDFPENAVLITAKTQQEYEITEVAPFSVASACMDYKLLNLESRLFDPGQAESTFRDTVYVTENPLYFNMFVEVFEETSPGTLVKVDIASLSEFPDCTQHLNEAFYINLPALQDGEYYPFTQEGTTRKGKVTYHINPAVFEKLVGKTLRIKFHVRDLRGNLSNTEITTAIQL
jgi:hypothetical protein